MYYRLCVWRVGLAVALVGLAWGAGAQNGKEPSPSPPSREVAVPVSVAIKTDKKTYKSSEPIKMTLTVKNSSHSAVSLRFSSGQKYDVEIRKGKERDGEKVWQWSRGMMFTQALVTVNLASGKTLTYDVTYTPSDKPGAGQPAPLKPGTYTLTATLTTMGRAPRPTGSTMITVP